MKEDFTIKNIYNKYYNKAYLFVLSYINDRDVVDDIVSESMIKVWKELKHGEKVEYDIKPFLFSILKNASLDYLRHLKMQQNTLNKLNSIQQKELDLKIISLESSAYDEVLVREIQDIVNTAMRKMKNRTQTVFRLSRFELLTNKKIAAKLNITEKGVEYHISIALKMLRHYLKDYISLFFILSYYVFF